MNKKFTSYIFKILAGIGITATSIIVLYHYFKPRNIKLFGLDENSWIFPLFLVLPYLISLLSLFKKPSEEKIREIINEAFAEHSAAGLKLHQNPQQPQPTTSQELFLDGLPETDDPKMRELLLEGTKELKRASEIQKTISEGDFETGKQYHEATLRAIEIYKKGLSLDPKFSEKAALLNLIGLAYLRISELDEALEYWKEMEKIAGEMTSSSDKNKANEGYEAQAVAYGNMGIIYKTRGDLDVALEMYDKTTKAIKITGNKVNLPVTYCNMGNIYGIIGNLEKALEMHYKALEIDLSIGNKYGIATDYGNIGIVYRNYGDLNKALEMHKKALEIATEIGNKSIIAGTYSNIGNIYQTSGDMDEAIEMYNKALELYKEIGGKEGMAIQYSNIGNIYQVGKKYDRAIEMHNKALEIDKDMKNKVGIATNYGNIGIVYRNLGDLDKAQEMYIEALKIAEEIGIREIKAIQYGNIGNIFLISSDFDKALEMYVKAIEIDENMGNKEGVASNYANMGLVYKTHGNLKPAREYYKKALDLFTQIGAKDKIQWCKDRLDELDSEEE